MMMSLIANLTHIHKKLSIMVKEKLEKMRKFKNAKIKARRQHRFKSFVSTAKKISLNLKSFSHNIVE